MARNAHRQLSTTAPPNCPKIVVESPSSPALIATWTSVLYPPSAGVFFRNSTARPNHPSARLGRAGRCCAGGRFARRWEATPWALTTSFHHPRLAPSAHLRFPASPAPRSSALFFLSHQWESILGNYSARLAATRCHNTTYGIAWEPRYFPIECVSANGKLSAGVSCWSSTVYAMAFFPKWEHWESSTTPPLNTPT